MNADISFVPRGQTCDPERGKRIHLKPRELLNPSRKWVKPRPAAPRSWADPAGGRHHDGRSGLGVLGRADRGPGQAVRADPAAARQLTLRVQHRWQDSLAGLVLRAVLLPSRDHVRPSSSGDSRPFAAGICSWRQRRGGVTDGRRPDSLVLTPIWLRGDVVGVEATMVHSVGGRVSVVPVPRHPWRPWLLGYDLGAVAPVAALLRAAARLPWPALRRREKWIRASG